MDTRKYVPIKVKINFEPTVVGGLRSDAIKRQLNKSGIDCTVTTTVNSFVISVHTKTNVILSLAGHLEYIRVVNSLEKMGGFKGPLKVTAVSVYDRYEYNNYGQKQSSAE